MALRIAFAGSGEFGLPTLRALGAAGHEVTQIISQVDRPAGRGAKLTPTPISRHALENDLALVRTVDINTDPAVDLDVDVLVVIAFGQKIVEPLVNRPRLGSINLHSSRLPRFRGAAPINHAILAGDAITGNSVIRLARKMDAGAVLGQSALEIGPAETAGELHDRLSVDGATIVLRVLEELAAGRTVETTQDESQAMLAPKLSRESARLDFALPADVLARQIRGLYPWPGCRVRLVGSDETEIARLTLVRAVARPGGGPPGTIDKSLAVAAGAGSVEILELQPEGKRPMPLAAFRNGRPWEAGMRLESIA